MGIHPALSSTTSNNILQSIRGQIKQQWRTLRLKLNVKIWGMKIANSTITTVMPQTKPPTHLLPSARTRTHTPLYSHYRSSIFVQAGLVFARRKHVCEISVGCASCDVKQQAEKPPHKLFIGKAAVLCHQPPFLFCFTERLTTEAHIQLFPTPIFFFPVI